MHSTEDLCSILAALGLRAPLSVSCSPVWHGSPHDHWKQDDPRKHKFYLLLGGDDIAATQMGVYTEWARVRSLVKDTNDDWRRGVKFFGNHGATWTYASVVAHWQQDCGKGLPGHRCMDTSAMAPASPQPPTSSSMHPPSYMSTLAQNVASSSNTLHPTTPSRSEPRRSSPIARSDASSHACFIVIDGDSEVYTDDESKLR
ncbi:hypothetical protein EV122DRAFT_283395 [Schizophyllum commune]